MERKLRFAIFEDSRDVQFTIALIIEDAGHEVVGRANDVPSSEKLVGNLESLEVDYMSLDGGLGLNSTIEDPNADGRYVLGITRKSAPRVKVIGMPGRGTIPGVDYSFNKTQWEEFAEFIEKLK